MVLPGQFLERPTLIPVSGTDEVMEGLSHRGTRRPSVLLVPPTPDEGGSMDHIVAAEVAWACAIHGHPTLRFNFRGIGASQGARNSGLRADVEAALTVLEENAYSPAPVVVSIGASAAVVLELADQRHGIVGVVAVNPVAVAPESFLRGKIPVLAVVAQEDDRIPRAALSAALAEAGGTLEIVPGTGPTYTRNLPEVGKAVVRFLQTLGIGS